MKKLLPCIFISLFLFSCSKTDYPTLIYGTFSQTAYSENELSNNPEDVDDIFAVCNTKKVSKLTFGEDGSYSFDITQNLEDITFETELEFSLEEIVTFFERKLKVTGTYSLKNNKITLVNEFVVFEDGTQIPFEEYMQIDAAVGNKNQTVKFDVDENYLNLYYGKNVITYYRK